MAYANVRCDSCQVAYINGVRCHEQGCPDAWRDHTRECFECGFDFKPSERGQSVCDDCANFVEPEYDIDGRGNY